MLIYLNACTTLAHALRSKYTRQLFSKPRFFFQGIEPEDAVYLPAVETALSLVHDVHPRVGEKVAVFGQGMIGYVSLPPPPPAHARTHPCGAVAVTLFWHEREKID